MRLQCPLKWSIQRRLLIAALLCPLTSALIQSRAEDTVKPVEELVRCSDLVVLASLKETLHDGIVTGPSNMVYTRHVLTIERYYVGSGPRNITVLTPGGYDRGPDGRETFTSIVGDTGPGVVPDESFVAFLQVFGPAYRFVPRGGSKASVTTDDSTGDRMVRLHFGKAELLGDAARERYEKVRREFSTISDSERVAAWKRVEYALTEVFPVAQLPSRLDKVVADVGGPKSPKTICY